MNGKRIIKVEEHEADSLALIAQRLLSGKRIFFLLRLLYNIGEVGSVQNVQCDFPYSI